MLAILHPEQSWSETLGENLSQEVVTNHTYRSLTATWFAYSRLQKALLVLLIFARFARPAHLKIQRMFQNYFSEGLD